MQFLFLLIQTGTLNKNSNLESSGLITWQLFNGNSNLES